MKFFDLYNENRKSVVDALTQMWCSETANESQRAYAKRIEKLIPELFAPSKAIPLVQCMNLYKPVYSVSGKEAEALVGNMWEKIPKKEYYPPYEHQYQCWKHLLQEDVNGKPKSICVTTGTGSGKTECFMLPLVYDLDRQQKANPDAESRVQALFLYPLNALMEDQKERLEQLLEGTNLTYAVYNGDLPEKEPGPKDHSDNAEKVRKSIEKIRGWDEEKQDYRFKHILYTREQVRKQRPNILLTNPTMLEYVLLRKKDEKLIDPKEKSLQWVAIDETHTYTGAGAAELAMLLRRVLLAFDVDARNVHFATSSATFGNAEEDERKLKEFIAGITGTGIEQIDVEGGERTGENKIPNNEDKERWINIFKKDFVTLSSLFPDKPSVEEQLKALDEMVDRMGDCTDLKVKVHYFFRVPNNGIYVRLDQINDDGTFQLYTENKLDTNNNVPLIELVRCKNCGEYVAVVYCDKNDGTYQGMVSDDSDLFDLEEIETNDNYETKVIALSNSRNKKGQGNSIYKMIDGKLMPSLPGEKEPEEWHIVANQHYKCPYCNCKLSRIKDSNKDLDVQTKEDVKDDGTLKKFRLSAEFISRIMAPPTLDQLDKFSSKKKDEKLLHEGQQYISFADSRQLAAKATLKQNQEQERMWFYSTIYHLLCKRKVEGNSKTIDELKAKMKDAMASCNMDEVIALGAKIKELEGDGMGSPTFSWAEIADYLFEDKDGYCDRFCYEFVKRTANSKEIDREGKVDENVKKKYIQSMMTMYLTSRPRSAAAPETMGLFHPCYKKLENITVPTTVENTFNKKIKKPENRISDKDWKDLLQVFIDYRVRSDQSIFLEQKDLNIDIFDTVRFAVEKQFRHRKPATEPELDKKRFSTSRIVRYLCALLRKDNPSIESDREAYRLFFDEINNVVKAMWHDLTVTTKLLRIGRHIDKKNNRWEDDSDGGIRLNLADMSFELYEDVYLCDTNSEYDDVTNHAECLRPIETNFKGYSPYLSGGKAVELDKNTYRKWEPYPYYVGSGKEKSVEEIKEWSRTHRANLWLKDKEIWGESGVFFDRLNDVHQWPNLFIQAEHTAQVDKMVSRQLQQDFKNHRINILACSTTMEMGVDLGTLQLVMLSSVPPQPANYKQRAGRSGRNPKMVRSACITLCGSDTIGIRTLYNPLECIINRTVEVPKVDLKSPQVVQRHVNSFLIRALGVFGNGSVNQRVMDYYTTFHIERQGGWEVFDNNNRKQDPITKLGNDCGTMYADFNSKCDTSTIESTIKSNIETLLRDTCFEGKVDDVINTAREENKRCYDELNERLDDIKCAYVGCTGKTKRDERFRKKLNFEYMEILTERLLSFWATHRFSPNANMPVNVLELDLDPMGEKEWDYNSTSSNPSYSLREAIAQYSPGNSVVVDGVVYAVRGIVFQNKYQGARAFKRIARNNDETVMGSNVDTLSGKKEWWDKTGRYEMELVEPVGFIPDMNEENTRIIDNNERTHVNAQLIGANRWDDVLDNSYKHLYMVRCNRDSGEAKILYYNEGIGYGYCLCTRCGRMVLEREVPKNDPTNPSAICDLPVDFNTVHEKKIDPVSGLKVNDDSKPLYHFAISGKETGMKCGGSNDANDIRRNVIVGGLLQTDFSEIKIRHTGCKWMHDRTTERNLLFTLGIVFSQALVEILGKERNAVDFAILPFGHLCIFDTNPGGAGYSNQLAYPEMMDKVIVKSEQLLNIAKNNSKEYLLDKFTLRFERYVDIQAALDWIEEEHKV